MGFWNQHMFGWGGWGAVGDPNIRPAPYYAAIGDPRLQPAWLVVTTVNAQTGVPLIEHRFYGATQADAQKRYEIHLQADKFLAACGGAAYGQPSEYNGTPCQSTWRWERA